FAFGAGGPAARQRRHRSDQRGSARGPPNPQSHDRNVTDSAPARSHASVHGLPGVASHRPNPQPGKAFCSFLGPRAHIVGENVQLGLHCGRKWGNFAAASRGGGAPPTPPPRLDLLDWSLPQWLSAAPSTTPSTQRTGSRFRRATAPPSLREWCWRCPSTSSPTWACGARRSTSATPSAPWPSCRRSPPGSPSSSASSTAAPTTPSWTLPGASWFRAFSAITPSSARRSLSWGPATAWSCGTGPAGTNTDRRCSTASQRSPRALTILLDMTATHIPVLADELLELLDPCPGQVAIDCTFGGGGHARMVAEQLGPEGTLVAIDRDPLAEERFLELAEEAPCSLRFLRGGYAEGLQMLAEEGVRADLVYLDLGMSSMQIDTRERGFSYSYDAPLDMRMDPRQELSAREIVATWDERRLAGILRELGEERHATQIARAIVRRRGQAPIDTTLALVEVISSAIPTPARFGAGHPAKRTFQALRIAVNDELGQLDEALPLAWRILREGGVLAGISFHSLEDRRVKRFLAERARGCICPPDLPVCGCGREPEAALL